MTKLIAIASASGVFPDGTPFSIPENDEPPQPLDIGENVHDEMIYLCLATRRPDAKDFGTGDGLAIAIEHESLDEPKLRYADEFRDGVVRPLIDCRRADVLAYARERGLPFVNDPSNHQRAFERVRIRHEVLPVLVTEDPRIVEHLCDLSDEASELEAYLDALTPDLPSPGARFASPETLGDLPRPVQVRWLRAWIARETGLTPSRAHLTQLGRLVTGRGEVLLGSGWSVRREGDGLSLEYREHRRTRSNRS